jgi:predicted component of type VI protein secretion system
MKLSLVVLTPGKQEGKVLEVKLTQFVIGRDQQCHLRPASPMISKRHCALLQRDGKAFLRDFGSTNGSFVNDEPVKGEVELKNEDRLKIGPLLFTVRLDAAAPVNRPTPPPATRTVDKAAGNAKPKQATGDKTPPPPTKAQGDDDDIAAMLLSIGDEDNSGAIPVGPDGVPEGSTQMDILVPPGTVPDPAATASAGDGTKDNKEPKDKGKGNTAVAAKSILEKMMRRPRT